MYIHVLVSGGPSKCSKAIGERGANEAPFFLFLKYFFNRKQQTHNYDSANRFILNVHYLIEIVKLIILISILISIEL